MAKTRKELKASNLVDFIIGLGAVSYVIHDSENYETFIKEYPKSEIPKVDYEFVKATINYLLEHKYMEVAESERNA